MQLINDNSFAIFGGLVGQPGEEKELLNDLFICDFSTIKKK